MTAQPDHRVRLGSASQQRPGAGMLPRLRRRAREENGSMTLLITGFLVTLLMVTAMGVAVTSVHLDRSALQHLSDSAAIRGAQAFADPAFYGVSPDLVGEAAARQAVREHVAAYPEQDERISAVSIASITVDGDGTVRVRLTARTRPPLTGWFLRGEAAPIPLTVDGMGRSG